MCKTGLWNVSYNEWRTATQNLYYHVFDKWPERDYSKYMKKLVIVCVKSISGSAGYEICRYFGLDCERKRALTDSEFGIVLAGLNIMRNKLSTLLEILYSYSDSDKFWEKVSTEAFKCFEDHDYCMMFVKMATAVRVEIECNREGIKERLERLEVLEKENTKLKAEAKSLQKKLTEADEKLREVDKETERLYGKIRKLEYENRNVKDCDMCYTRVNLGAVVRERDALMKANERMAAQLSWSSGTSWGEVWNRGGDD